MGLLLQLFVVTTLIAVLHSAPLDEHSESTTVGIRPLPATLNKKDESKESDEDKADIKRVSRDIPLPPPTQTKDTLNSQSSTSKPQFGSRPARDTQHFISGVPSPQSQPNSNPQTYQQNPQQPQLGAQNPSTQSRPARDTTHFISGVPTPQSQQNSNPQTYQQNPPQRQLGTSQYPSQTESRRVRDTTHPGSQAKVQTRPAPLPAKNGQKPTSSAQKDGSRRVREAGSSSTSTERSDN
ncbi:pollen-specific leucine-rich repeat extensin-like protein 1 [Tribolium madens]|uniref:pollen-specific leucine-rich repeat extensin-like protein 1 n=1 Tax=Tribolium madens TaxID=41895 RepID=UPI001CF7265F|nr:pollen-specific leucine-rich repeat extensin-like protein 1 [Tribolium madens]